MKKLLTIISLVFLLCFTFGCQKGEEVAEEPAMDVDAEKANIQLVFDQYAQAWKAKNIDLFAEIFSHDADMVIFDTQTRYDGGEAWKERLQNSFDLIDDVNVTFRDYSIKVHPSGTVAWLSAFEDATWTSEGQANELTGMRITWILEKLNGKWVIVEGHWSVSEPEEEE
ncbi:MAG: nuclear transport factor 2 family protein [Candidatus Aminicenantes bacterium]|nr:MAG: nuclear transport factor 2 family protein [Candidatus Aminicenantes bacterium]